MPGAARQAPIEVTVDARGQEPGCYRFDRSDGLRTGFTSALTMLEASDGEQRSYLEIAEVIERHSSRAVADLRELYRRIVCARKFYVEKGQDRSVQNYGGCGAVGRRGGVRPGLRRRR